MPRAAAAKVAKEVPKKAAPKKRQARAYKLPETIPAGEILTDLNKKEWKLGPTVGKGGFGELYLAGEAASGTVDTNARYVVKIEPKDNGPLFVEQAFYQRCAKADMVNDWKKTHHLTHLGVPKFIGAGMHSRGKTEFRFLVMERFGEDVWKKYLACGKHFSVKTAFTLGLQILDSLAYIHSTGYTHADIKSANLLLGFDPKDCNKVFLVDYGLCVRFCPNGQHREYKVDPKKAHDGTPEFASRDAHNGVVPSRRSDLEILGYVIIQWLAGSLPWEDRISEVHTDFVYVTDQKQKYMANISSLMKKCFPAGDHPVELKKYMEYVSKLKYEEVPDYKHLKGLFTKAITASGCKADGKLDFTPPAPAASSNEDAKSRKRKAVSSSNDELPKKVAVAGRARKPAPLSSSDSDSDTVAPPVKGRRKKAASSPKPKATTGKKPSAKSPARSSPSKQPGAKSPSGVKRGQAMKSPLADRKKSPGRPKGTKSSKAESDEVFIKRRRKLAVATSTSATQTSPGVKKTPKITKKR